MRLRISLLVFATAVVACAAPRAQGPEGERARTYAPPAPPPGHTLLPIDGPARAWVDSILADLTLAEKVGQLMMPWMSGQYVPAGSVTDSTLNDWVRHRKVGGFVVSIGPPVGLAAKLNRLQRAADVPLLVATDMEHGPGQRLDGGVLLPWGTELGGGTNAPPVMAIGAADDPELAYDLGRLTAIEARAVGIHMDFAPVVDVNNNPANPIINTRSYGADPARVARLGAAHVRGLQDHGMLATAKHFPGHGDTSEDSHIVPLILRIDAARADSIELPPFRAAIEAGVAGVMSAHIVVPALSSGDSTLPATLSSSLLDSLLVREMGFEGLIVTDALNMGAIVQEFGAGDAAVLALEAGADILLMPPDLDIAIRAVLEAVASGRVTEARVDRSVRKLLEAKARVGLHRSRLVDPEAVAERVGIPAHDSLAARMAERGITLVRDHDGLVPLRPLRDRRVLSVVYTDDVDPFAGRVLHSTLAAGLPSVRRVLLGPGEAKARLDSLRILADSADLVVFTASVRVRSHKGSVAVEPAVAEQVRAIAGRRPLVVVSLGNPYILQQMPGAGTYLLGWGKEAASQSAAARALLGEIPVTGRLPIDIPPLHALGEGIHRAGTIAGTREAASAIDAGLAPRFLDSADAAIASAITGGVTPGAALAVGGPGGLARLRGYGATDWAPASPGVADSTLYDLASLTKVVGTTTAVMLMVDDGRMSLDAPLSEYLPVWPRGGWRDSVTVRRLLTHEAGLPAFVRFWHPDAGGLRGPDAVLRAIARLEPAYEPGTSYVYSDLGFILLAAAVEAVAGRPLPELLAERVWRPLGMRDTGYNPVPERMAAVRAEGGLEPVAPGGGSGAGLGRIAPTERDTVFRHRHVHGVVHDENAYALGGVAGHAGLFSSARDLATFARMLLGGGRVDGVRIVSPAVVARFTAPGAARAPGSRRILGWDTPPGSGAMAGSFSTRAFGHTGFTGTSLWVDPARDVFVVLLTNRVNPTRDNPRIARLRRDVHDAVVRAAGVPPATRY